MALFRCVILAGSPGPHFRPSCGILILLGLFFIHGNLQHETTGQLNENTPLCVSFSTSPKERSRLWVGIDKFSPFRQLCGRSDGALSTRESRALPIHCCNARGSAPEAAELISRKARHCNSLRQSTGNHAIDIAALDLAELRSVKAFADFWKGPLHILVNNAGIMAVPERQRRMSILPRLAHFARGVASFASYSHALFGQNEIVAGSRETRRSWAKMACHEGKRK